MTLIMATPVGRSLEMCQILFGDSDPERMYHKNNGNCAELMGSHLYYKENTVKLAKSADWYICVLGSQERMGENGTMWA
jgi:hypothetical protein